MLSRIVPEKRNASWGTIAELLVERDLVVVVDRDAVDAHLPGRGVVEARRRASSPCDFPAPVSPTSATVSPGRDVQVDTAQRFVDRGGVPEVHVLELDLAPQAAPGSTGSAGGGTVVGGPEQLGDAVDRDPRLLVRVEHLRELLDRREEQVEVQQERDQRSRPCSAPCATSTLPAPSTMHVAMSARKSTNGK